MPDLDDSKLTRRQWAVAQLAAVYLIGGLTLPAGSYIFVILVFGGGVAAAGLGLLVVLAGVVGLLFLAGTATRHGSPATATTGRRLWWAIVVVLGGAAGLGASAWLTVVADVEYGSPEPWILAAGLPYLLVAAFFIGPRPRLVALLVVVAVGGTVVYTLQRDHAEAEQTEVLALLQDPLDLIYTAEIPGYRRTTAPTSARTAYEPVDQAVVKYWREKDIVVTVSHTAVQGADCGPEPLLTPAPPPDLDPPDASAGTPAPAPPSPSPSSPSPAGISCTAEGSSLHYRQGPGAHEYLRTAGDTVIRAGAGTVVDKALLKEAVLTARPLSVDELRHELYGR